MSFPQLMSVGVARLAATVFSVTALASCSGADVRPATLDGEWQLVGDHRALGQTLSFAEAGRVSGNGGCNRYTGTIEVDAGGGLHFGPIAATKRACLEEGRMAAEAGFFDMLGKVRGYASPGEGRLRLLDAEGRPLAEFERLQVR